MKTKIYHKLKSFFNPLILEVENESELHKGHSQSPNSGNSHFFVKIKSVKLSNISKVEGQRMIYEVLSKEMSNEIHALRIQILY